MTSSDPAPSGQDTWMHDLRNAVNAVTMAVVLGRRGAAEGDLQRVETALAHAEQGLARVRCLLMPPDATPARQIASPRVRRSARSMPGLPRMRVPQALPCSVVLHWRDCGPHVRCGGLHAPGRDLMSQPARPLLDRRILLVEDDYLLAGALAAALEGAGARVFGPVGTIEGAIGQLADVDDLDAVILDANLDGRRVDGVADFARERAVPIVFVSGYDREFLPARFADVPHCLKPVDIDELSNLLVSRVLR